MGGINDQADGVFLHGGDDALYQPRHVLKQALAGGLARGDINQYLLARNVELARDLLNGMRQKRHRIGRGDGQAKIGAGQCLAGEIA